MASRRTRSKIGLSDSELRLTASSASPESRAEGALKPTLRGLSITVSGTRPRTRIAQDGLGEAVAHEMAGRDPLAPVEQMRGPETANGFRPRSTWR